MLTLRRGLINNAALRLLYLFYQEVLTRKNKNYKA